MHHGKGWFYIKIFNMCPKPCERNQTTKHCWTFFALDNAC